MQILPINNKYQSTKFCARIKIDGNINDIPLKTISGWMDRAKTIGNDSDGIILHFGKQEKYEYLKKFLGLIPIKQKVISRSIFALADIKNESFDKELSYFYKKTSFDEKSYIEKAITEYFDILTKISKK